MHFCNFYIFFAIFTLMTLEGFWNKVLTSLLYFILVHIISNCVSRSGLILQLGQVISVLIWRGCDVKPSWKNQSEKTVQSEEIGSNAVKIINLRKLFQIISGKYYFYILIIYFLLVLPVLYFSYLGWNQEGRFAHCDDYERLRNW